MAESFGIVVIVVVGVTAVVAAVAFLGARRLYDDIGRGGLSLREDGGAPRPAPAGPAAGAADEREAEIRQMLEARNARRARAGEPPLHLDAELARLTAPAADPGLQEEVRQLVIARNERRARAGEPPLDVEAEVARQLAELGR